MTVSRVSHEEDKYQQMVDFGIIDLMMMSIFVMILISTKALDAHVTDRFEATFQTPGMHLFMSIAFIFFTVVWTQGRDEISPLKAAGISFVLFFVIVAVFNMETHFVIFLTILLFAYFLVDHMQIYREHITKEERESSWYDWISWQISHDTHDKLIDAIAILAVITIVIGTVVQIRTFHKEHRGTGFLQDAWLMFKRTISPKHYKD